MTENKAVMTTGGSMRTIDKSNVGRYAESRVSTKLIEQGWSVYDLNLYRMNALRYDFFAYKHEGEPIHINVKSHRMKDLSRAAFRLNIGKGKPKLPETGKHDYMVFVMVADNEADDRFYIVPSATVWKVIIEYWHWWCSRVRPNGQPYVDDGTVALSFFPAPYGEVRPGWGLDKEWERYRDAWHTLDEGQS
jgi:hypothetical protein